LGKNTGGLSENRKFGGLKFSLYFCKKESTMTALQRAEALLPQLTERETDLLLDQIFNRDFG
jgi:hypothetical protein